MSSRLRYLSVSEDCHKANLMNVIYLHKTIERNESLVNEQKIFLLDPFALYA